MAHSQAPSRANFGSCHLAKCRFKSFDPGVNVSPVGNRRGRLHESGGTSPSRS